VWYWNLESDAFGRQAPNGPLTFNFRFPGQYYDAETGLNYNKFRDYEASSARYVESDPIGLMGGINSYSYVKSSPMKYSDEFGLSGSAPVWNQDQWRDPSRRLWTNCWGYALNLPGQHGNPNNDKFYLGMNCSNLMAASKAAGLIDPTAGGDCGGDCPSGYYKVQVFADEGYLNPDMHFYRQDADGGWSHKRGALLPENRDSDDVPLTCPMNQASKYSDRTYKYCGTLCRRI
jgi:RHS repeat-associated protein